MWSRKPSLIVYLRHVVALNPHGRSHSGMADPWFSCSPPVSAPDAGKSSDKKGRWLTLIVPFGAWRRAGAWLRQELKRDDIIVDASWAAPSTPSTIFEGFFAVLFPPSCPVTSCSRFSNSCRFSCWTCCFDLPGVLLAKQKKNTFNQVLTGFSFDP